jgi:hypothetical protein
MKVETLKVISKGRWKLPVNIDISTAFFVYIPLEGGLGCLLVPGVTAKLESQSCRVPFLEKERAAIGSLHCMYETIKSDKRKYVKKDSDPSENDAVT